MTLKLYLPENETWETVETQIGTFEVLVRLPSFEDRMRHTAIRASGGGEKSDVDAETEAQAMRISTAIRDWRGLVDKDDQPIPLNPKTLSAICGSFPEIFNRISILASNAFARIEYPEPKAGDTKGN